MPNPIINFKSVRSKALSAQKFRKETEVQARYALNEAKEKLIEDFYNHKVTKEIAGGPDSQSLSGTVIGGGNLYGFIGFNYDPLPAVEQALKEKIKLGKSTRVGETYQYRVHIPEKELYAVSKFPKLPGQSWLEGIERGVSNIHHYLSLMGKGRSGGGIQVKGDTKKEFSTTDYFTGLFKKFVNRLKRNKYTL